MLKQGIGNFVWASGSGRGEVRGSRKKFSSGKGAAKQQVRLLRAHGSAELGKVASGSASLDLWLGKSGISGNRQRPKPTPGERNSWGSYESKTTRKKSQRQNEGENIQI